MATKQEKLDWLEQAKHYIMQEDDCFEEYLANQFDDNYYDSDCVLWFGRQKVEVESIWTDFKNHINIHVDSKYFEGDVLMKSLSQDNQRLIIEMIWERTINEE